MKHISPERRLAELLHPYISDKDSYNRLYADITDSIDTCRWLIDTVTATTQVHAGPEDLETLLINMDLRLRHLDNHVSSLRAAIPVLLKALADETKD